jgi:phage host-nuclease inhibitor protein Gam
MSEDVRLCGYIGCRKPLVRKPGESEGKFKKREHCDKVCCGLQKGVRSRAERDELSRKGKKKKTAKPVKWRPVPPAVGSPPVAAVAEVNQELLRARMYRGALL